LLILLTLGKYNAEGEKPYNAADARHVGFPKFGGKEYPHGGGISGVGRGVSELLQAVYTNTQGW